MWVGNVAISCHKGSPSFSLMISEGGKGRTVEDEYRVLKKTRNPCELCGFVSPSAHGIRPKPCTFFSLNKPQLHMVLQKQFWFTPATWLSSRARYNKMNILLAMNLQEFFDLNHTQRTRVAVFRNNRPRDFKTIIEWWRETAKGIPRDQNFNDLVIFVA